MKTKANKYFYIILSVDLLILLLTAAGMVAATYLDASYKDLQIKLYDDFQTAFQLGIGIFFGLLGGRATK